MSEDLFTLQGKVLAKPELYEEEVMRIYNHFKSLLDVAAANQSKVPDELFATFSFLCQVSKSSKKILPNFPQEAVLCVQKHLRNVDLNGRHMMIRGLILLHNRKQIASPQFNIFIFHIFVFIFTNIRVFPVFFSFFPIPDREFRKILYLHIVSFLKKLNQNSHQSHLLGEMKSFLFKEVNSENFIVAKRAMDVIIAMFNKNIW
jgi:hypothetical protein